MAIDALNKLCKWRSVLAGWHTGSKPLLTAKGEPAPGVQAMRDLMDKWLIMRVENTALASLCIEKGVFSAEEWTERVEWAAGDLDKVMEGVFPGFRTADYGVEIYDLKLAQKTMREKGFPE